MFLYPLVKKKHAQLFPVYHQGPSLESCSLAFPKACDLPGLLKRLAAATRSAAPGSVSCLPSTQPSALARSPRDESPELSSFGEIPCLLYLDIPEAKGTAGQQSAGTKAWCRESLYVLSLSFTLCESTRLISHWTSPGRRQNWARLSWCSTPVTAFPHLIWEQRPRTGHARRRTPWWPHAFHQEEKESACLSVPWFSQFWPLLSFTSSVVSDSLRPHVWQVHPVPLCPLISWSLLKFMSSEPVRPSHPLSPLLLLPSLLLSNAI